jgi:hypothetical protein
MRLTTTYWLRRGELEVVHIEFVVESAYKIGFDFDMVNEGEIMKMVW